MVFRFDCELIHLIAHDNLDSGQLGFRGSHERIVGDQLPVGERQAASKQQAGGSKSEAITPCRERGRACECDPHGRTKQR